jgi:hypothetical protein
VRTRPTGSKVTRQQLAKRSLPKWLEEEALRAFEVLEPKCGSDELIEAVTEVGLAYEIYHRRTSTKAQCAAPPNIPAIHVLEDSFGDQIGFDRKELKTVIARMRTCAKDLKRLRVSVLVRELSRAYPPKEDGATVRPLNLRKVLSNLGSFRSWLSTLPFRLDQLADATEFAAKEVSFRGQPLYDAALASLVRFVHKRAGRGRWHDAEVSVLVGAVTGRHPNYNTEAHRRWRMTHRKLCGM